TVARARAIEPGEPLALEPLRHLERRAPTPGHRNETDRRFRDHLREDKRSGRACHRAVASLSSAHPSRLHPGRTLIEMHRLCADKTGDSHFQDVEIEYAETTRAGRLSKRMPATGIIFREVQPDYDLDWHPAPRRQYIINLDAGVQITASDG